MPQLGKAGGKGKGWHGDSLGHSKAARGIRIRPEIGMDLKKAEKDRQIKKKRLHKLREEQRRLIASDSGTKWLEEADPVKREKKRLQIVEEMDRLGDIKLEISRAEDEFDEASYHYLDLMNLHSEIGIS